MGLPTLSANVVQKQFVNLDYERLQITLHQEIRACLAPSVTTDRTGTYLYA